MCWRNSTWGGLAALIGLLASLAPRSADGQAVSFGQVRPFVIGFIPVVGRGGVGGVSIDAAGVVSRCEVEETGRLREARLRALAPISGEMAAASKLRKISLRGLI